MLGLQKPYISRFFPSWNSLSRMSGIPGAGARGVRLKFHWYFHSWMVKYADAFGLQLCCGTTNVSLLHDCQPKAPEIRHVTLLLASFSSLCSLSILDGSLQSCQTHSVWSLSWRLQYLSTMSSRTHQETTAVPASWLHWMMASGHSCGRPETDQLRKASHLWSPKRNLFGKHQRDTRDQF